MNTIAFLIADGNAEFVKLILVVLFFIVVAIIKVLAKIGEFLHLGKPQQIPDKKEEATFIDIAKEIEKFLRQAIGEDVPEEKREVVAKKPEKIKVNQAPQAAATQQTATEKTEKPRPVSGQVEKHVQKYLDEQKFTSRASKLGGEVVQAEQHLGEHLKQVFEHQVSKLETAAAEVASPSQTAKPSEPAGVIQALSPTGIFQILSNPESLREAIILSEILHRPEERWDTK